MTVLPAPDDLTAAEISARASGPNAAVAGPTSRDIQTMTFLVPTRVSTYDERPAHPAPERWVEGTLRRVRTSIEIDG